MWGAESWSKKDMIRVIMTAAEDELLSQIVLDATGRKNGRGAYVCPNSECLRAAIKKQGSGTIIKNAKSSEVYDTLTKEMEKFENQIKCCRCLALQPRRAVWQAESFSTEKVRMMQGMACHCRVGCV